MASSSVNNPAACLLKERQEHHIQLASEPLPLYMRAII
jgi:hypothetical protein